MPDPRPEWGGKFYGVAMAENYERRTGGNCMTCGRPLREKRMIERAFGGEVYIDRTEGPTCFNASCEAHQEYRRNH